MRVEHYDDETGEITLLADSSLRWLAKPDTSNPKTLLDYWTWLRGYLKKQVINMPRNKRRQQMHLTIDRAECEVNKLRRLVK